MAKGLRRWSWDSSPPSAELGFFPTSWQLSRYMTRIAGFIGRQLGGILWCSGLCTQQLGSGMGKQRGQPSDEVGGAEGRTVFWVEYAAAAGRASLGQPGLDAVMTRLNSQMAEAWILMRACVSSEGLYFLWPPPANMTPVLHSSSITWVPSF